MPNKRITELSTVLTAPRVGDYLEVDNATEGSAQIPVESLVQTPPPPPNPEPTSTGNYLESGNYAFVDNLTVELSACQYIIGGTRYNSGQQQLTASAADATHPRLDLIVLTTTPDAPFTGTPAIVAGTAAASPVEPSIDPATQLRLGAILVAALATDLTVAEDVVYREGSGGEWTDTASGAGVNTTDATNSHLGSNAIKFTAATAGQYAQLVRGSSIDISVYNNLCFYVEAVTWASAKSLTVQLYLAGVAKGNPVSLRDGAFAFSRTTVGDYQLIVVPTVLFGTQGILVDTIRFIVAGGGTALTCFIDDIVLQGGIGASQVSTRLRDTGAYSSAKFYEANDLAYSGDIIYRRLIPGQGEAVSSTTAWVHFAYRTLLKHFAISFNPKAVCDGTIDRLFLMKVGPDFPNGLVITRWDCSFDADPATEADLDFKMADAYIGVANSAVIDVCDTTAGASSEIVAANINGGVAVANGKVLYLEFGTAYTTDNLQIIFEFWGYAA